MWSVSRMKIPWLCASLLFLAISSLGDCEGAVHDGLNGMGWGKKHTPIWYIYFSEIFELKCFIIIIPLRQLDKSFLEICIWAKLCWAAQNRLTMDVKTPLPQLLFLHHSEESGEGNARLTKQQVSIKTILHHLADHMRPSANSDFILLSANTAFLLQVFETSIGTNDNFECLDRPPNAIHFCQL